VLSDMVLAFAACAACCAPAGVAATACCALGAVEDARRVADKLDIPYYVLNFKEVFEDKVIKDFVQTYASGRTPNPCIRCNQFIKFDALLVKARQLGAEFVGVAVNFS